MSEREFRKHRHNIQMIFQDLDAALNPNMNIRQILTEILVRHEKISIDTLESRLKNILDDVNLEANILVKYPTELSGGQKRRVAIAAVLAINPKIIVADEPTSGLDSYTQNVVMHLITELQAKHALSIILISHDLQLIKQSCNRIAVLYLGNIVEIGTSDQITGKQAHPYTQLLWNAHSTQGSVIHQKHQLPKRKHNLRSGLHDFERPVNGCRFAPRCQRFRDKGQPEICTEHNSKPKLITLIDDHQVACHFPL
jgi:oligopeptide/dipeptide ABC transporter ATP-binding protein